jgi:ribonuclease P/MRP protein subunit POP5
MPKLLPPTQREKNRYIAFEIVSDQKFSRDEIVKAAWNSSLRYLGEKGASATSLWMMDWDVDAQRGIMKVNHTSVDDIKAALTLLSEIKKGENRYVAAYRTLTVSGTLKKLRAKTGMKANRASVSKFSL